jgi:hypothetical protein
MRITLVTSSLGRAGAERVASTLASSSRSVAYWHDLPDWPRGCPFEVAKPSEALDFYKKKNFALANLRAEGRRCVCNEFVLERDE